VATWTFTVAPGQYRVSATWIPHANRATDAPYKIFDGTSELNSVPIDQEQAPADFTDADAGSSWKDLGGPYTIAGNTLVVQLSNAANQYVIADAIRIERMAVGGGSPLDATLASGAGGPLPAENAVDRQTSSEANGFTDAGELTLQPVTTPTFDPSVFSARLPTSSGRPHFPATAPTSALNDPDDPQHDGTRGETALDLAIDRLVQSLAAANIRQLPNDRATDAVFENAADCADILLPDLKPFSLARD
jgi:hypothetical protein